LIIVIFNLWYKYQVRNVCTIAGLYPFIGQLVPERSFLS